MNSSSVCRLPHQHPNVRDRDSRIVLLLQVLMVASLAQPVTSSYSAWGIAPATSECAGKHFGVLHFLMQRSKAV